MIGGPSTRLWVRVEAKEYGLAVAGKPEGVLLEFVGHGGEGGEDKVGFPLRSGHEVCHSLFLCGGGREKRRAEDIGLGGRGTRRKGGRRKAKRRFGELAHFMARAWAYGIGRRGKRRRISDEKRVARPFPRHAWAKALSLTCSPNALAFGPALSVPSIPDTLPPYLR